MKIAFLLPVNGISGGIFVAYEHARRLLQKGHAVTLVFEDPALSKKITSYPGMEGVTTAYLSEIPAHEVFDIAIATWWETAYAIHALKARRYGYLVQAVEYNFYATPKRASRPFIEKSYEEAFAFFATTQTLQRFLKETYSKDSDLVPVSVNFERFASADPEVPKTGTMPRVLVEGPASLPFKRIPFTFSVLAEVDGAEVFYVSSHGGRDPAWKIDRFFEKVPYDRIPAVFAGTDFIVKLSGPGESFALPILEVFASGGTAVVSAFEGHQEYLKDGYNCLIVPIDDKAAAVAAVKRLIDDRGLLERLKQGARETCQRFSWDRSNEAFEKAIQEAVTSAPADARATTPLLDRYSDAHRDLKVLLDLPRRVEELELTVNHYRGLYESSSEENRKLTQELGEFRQALGQLHHRIAGRLDGELRKIPGIKQALDALSARLTKKS